MVIINIFVFVTQEIWRRDHWTLPGRLGLRMAQPVLILILKQWPQKNSNTNGSKTEFFTLLFFTTRVWNWDNTKINEFWKQSGKWMDGLANTTLLFKKINKGDRLVMSDVNE